MTIRVYNNFRPGAALLVVLFIIMVITVLSLGFLSRSDTELACGRNMVLRSRMDYLAESGLEQAKGLIINPHDLEGEYYTGASGLQLNGGSSDYYNISVIYDDSDPDDKCNYIIDCNAYELKNGERTGQSNLRAQLRLDPCIAFWSGAGVALSNLVTIHGDVYCNGTITNGGNIDGDVYADNIISITGSSKTGQLYSKSSLSLQWPEITVSGFEDKPGVTYQSGDYSLSGDIEGMLLVDGDLTVPDGTSVTITTQKNLPALYVKGDLIIGNNASLDINGLSAVNNNILINGNTNLNVFGGLFTKKAIFEIASDSSGNDTSVYLYNGTERSLGKYNGGLKFDGSIDYAEAENESLFDITNQITVSAWIKVGAFNKNFQAIVTKGDSAWRIQRYSNTSKIQFACTGLSHNQYGNIWGSKLLNYDQWYHVAGVYNGTVISLYIDGVLDASANTSGTINTNDYKVLIGENAHASGRYWNGYIDDVQIYNRALDPNEISTVKSGGTLSDLVAHWNFDETGSNIKITASPAKAAVLLWKENGEVTKWSQAAGAFYRSIERK